MTVLLVWNQLETIQAYSRPLKSREEEFDLALKHFAELRKYASKKQREEARKALLDETTEMPVEVTKPPRTEALPHLAPVTHRPEKTRSKSSEPGCPVWEPDWPAMESIAPQIRLDPDKFLIPVLTYGPNNQLRGFRETIFLALKLNRTIVPPPFYKHSRTDESKNDGDEDDLSLVVPPWQRIDLTQMAKSMSILNPFSLQHQCAKHFDIFFKTKPFYCTGGNIQRFNSMMTYLGMEWEHGNRLYKDKGACQLNKTIPDDSMLPTNGGPIHLKTTKSILESFYKSDERCALWVFPYHCIQFKNAIKAPGIAFENNGEASQTQINPDNEPDADLMQRIVRATPRPKYLRDIAHDFVTKFMEGGTGMAAIHWRYNHGDWLRHCEHHPSPACTAVLETIGHPVEIAQQIATYLRAHPHLKYLYIAAPLEEKPLIDNIRKELNDEFPIFTGEELLQFMLDSYPDCQWMKDNFHDIFSSLEQEMCYLSDTFLYAAGSSWSLNIVMERHASGKSDPDKNQENINLLFHVLRVLGIHIDEKGTILDQQ